MSLEISGVIVQIDPVQVVTDRFKKREFVLELSEEINGNVYTNYAKFQCVQSKCDLLDRYAVGEAVMVSFNIKGNRWEKDGKVNFITNLDAWRIQSTAANVPAPAPTYQQNVNNYAQPQQQFNIVPGGDVKDDLPF